MDIIKDTINVKVGEKTAHFFDQPIVSWADLTKEEKEYARETHPQITRPDFQRETAVHEALHKYYADLAGMPNEYVPCHLYRNSNGNVWVNLGSVKTESPWQCDGVAFFKILLAPSVAQRSERLRKIFGFSRDTVQFYMDLEQARIMRDDLNTHRIGSGTYVRKCAIKELLEDLETEQVQAAVLEEAVRARKAIFGNLPF
jgi:hypothetical protein